jgi:hypothetical protein
MSFMQLQIYQKGALYAVDCSRCGCTNYTHEWTNADHNDRRDAMQAGTLRCDECAHAVGERWNAMESRSIKDISLGQQYAGRYSAPGYMDCTSWSYGKNKRVLARELRDMYGE